MGVQKSNHTLVSSVWHSVEGKTIVWKKDNEWPGGDLTTALCEVDLDKDKDKDNDNTKKKQRQQQRMNDWGRSDHCLKWVRAEQSTWVAAKPKKDFMFERLHQGGCNVESQQEWQVGISFERTNSYCSNLIWGVLPLLTAAKIYKTDPMGIQYSSRVNFPKFSCPPNNKEARF